MKEKFGIAGLASLRSLQRNSKFDGQTLIPALGEIGAPFRTKNFPAIKPSLRPPVGFRIFP